MKKLTILTSVLALAACGGGSGGTGGSVAGTTNGGTTIPNAFDIPTSRVSSAAMTSNDKITKMASSVTNISEMTAAVEDVIGTEALNNIASNSESISSAINRSAVSRKPLRALSNNYSNKEKSAYIFVEGGKNFLTWANNKKEQFFEEHEDLVRNWGKVFCNCNVASLSKNQVMAIFDNVENRENWDNFYEENKYQETTVDNVKFETMITPRKVDSMKLFVAEDGTIDGFAFVLNESELSELTGFGIPAEWFEKINKTGDNEFSAEGATLSYNSYARNLGLKYSDFGVIGIDMGGDTGRFPFVGGYDEKKIATVDMPSGTTVFEGIAQGTVEYANDPSGHVEFLPIKDEQATLTFNKTTGSEELHADFSNWYEVSVSKTGDSVTMNFSNNRATDPKWTLNQANSTNEEFLKANYYGDNKNPTEATALFQYQEKIDSEKGISNNNKTVYIGFGGKAD